MNSHLVNIQGQINVESHQFTLASGAVTLKTRFTKWRPVGVVPYGASSIAAETFGIVGTPTADGWFVGDVVVESSEGSSALTGFVTIMGF